MKDIITPYASGILDLTQILKKGYPSAQIEVEVRFKNVFFQNFNRLKEKLKGYVKEHSISTDYINSSPSSNSTYRLTVKENGQQELLKKTTVYDEFIRQTNKSLGFNWGLKLSVGREETESYPQPLAPQIVNGQVANYTEGRRKDRFSYKVSDSVQIDLTHVINLKDESSSWEVEAELVGPINEKAMIELNSAINSIFSGLYDTSFIFSLPEKNAVAKFLNDNFSLRPEFQKPGIVDNNILVEARNLKRSDMVWGGLLGGKFEMSVTAKADGKRRLLVGHETGLWLIYPSYDFILISPECPPQFLNTVFDGEDLSPENIRPAFKKAYPAKHIYIPFDLLMDQNKNVTQLNHMERLYRAQERVISLPQLFKPNKNFMLGFAGFVPIEDLNQNGVIKPFVQIGPEPGQFFEQMRILSQFLELAPYETDGFILTPINTEYNPHTPDIEIPYKRPDGTTGKRLIRLSERRLTKYPDICKLKPEDKLTIDLIPVQNEDGTHTVKAVERKSKGQRGQTNYVDFVGTEAYPFDAERQIDWSDPKLNLPENTVVEFGPFRENDKIKLKFVKTRPEKPFPNNIQIANDVWEDINRPISKDTYEGESIVLLRYYHNRIKGWLYSGNPEKEIEPIPPGSWLIDIGSGKGGDLDKWQKLGHVLAIEPNAENIEEFNRRLSLKDPEFQSRVTLLQGGGEESQKILDKVKEVFPTDLPRFPRLYITSMLSLSFFFKDEEMLNLLVKTIKDIAEWYWSYNKQPIEFRFLTIEGEKVKALFEEKYPKSPHTGQIILNTIKMLRKEENLNEIFIDIPGTIVEKQTEYLVNLPLLNSKLDAIPKQTFIANDERFLNSGEEKFTQLFVYGISILNPKMEGRVQLSIKESPKPKTRIKIVSEPKTSIKIRK